MGVEGIGWAIPRKASGTVGNMEIFATRFVVLMTVFGLAGITFAAGIVPLILPEETGATTARLFKRASVGTEIRLVTDCVIWGFRRVLKLESRSEFDDIGLTDFTIEGCWQTIGTAFFTGLACSDLIAILLRLTLDIDDGRTSPLHNFCKNDLI